MGLDQYAYKRKANQEDVQIMYWRKHPRLEKWMSDLYYSKGGSAESFNCVELSLTKQDLESLELCYKTLPHADGFFWGMSTYQHTLDTATFIKDALQAIDEGYEIIYSSWW